MKSSAVISLAFVVLSPLACFAADAWAEKLFPNPQQCAFAEGGISYDVDQMKFAIWGPFPKVVADSLNAIGKKISKSCKAGETPDLDFIHDGKFFGSEYYKFTVPLYSLSGGSCMTDFYYSFTFREKAKVLHDNILRVTGKDLRVLPGSGSTEIDDDGWIADYGSYSTYTCSMIGY
ncbi:hypothetical protein ACCS88_06050 [Rhizobium ruizarguesonis]